jgi:hypothetical protein
MIVGAGARQYATAAGFPVETVATEKSDAAYKVLGCLCVCVCLCVVCLCVCVYA